MNPKAIQDYYAEEFAHCFGCGHQNHEGFQIKSFPQGDEVVCRFKPESKYSGGFPGNVYGGLIASLIDCHGAATASYAKHMEREFTLGKQPLSRFVTGSLKVDFMKPTPSDEMIELRSRVIEIKTGRVPGTAPRSLVKKLKAFS